MKWKGIEHGQKSLCSRMPTVCHYLKFLCRLKINSCESFLPMISKLSVSVITNTAFQRSWSQQAVKSTESAQHCSHSWEHDSDDRCVCFLLAM